MFYQLLQFDMASKNPFARNRHIFVKKKKKSNIFLSTEHTFNRFCFFLFVGSKSCSIDFLF